MKMVGEDDVAVDFEASLSELTFNSKPHINMLTMLAEENVQFASKIVDIIESHLHKVPPNQTMPTLYLIDSIVKNLPNSGYKELFNKNLVKSFITVFEKVGFQNADKRADEKTRASLYKLRDTWSGYFAPSKLYGIDIKAHAIDRAWPIQHPDRSVAANSPSSASPVSCVTPAGNSNAVSTSKSIHVNPDFLKGTKPNAKDDARAANGSSTNDNLEAKQKQLLQRLEQRKRELDRLTREANRASSGGSSHPHGHLQSVVTVPAPASYRDPRISRGGSSNQHRSSTYRSDKGSGRCGSVDTGRGDKGIHRGGSAELGERRHQQHRYQDVDLRSRNNAPSLPPKKRKPQSPAVESELESSVSKEKKKRSDMDIKRESAFPFGASEDQDLRVLYRPQPPPAVRIKEEILDDDVIEMKPLIPHQPTVTASPEKTPSSDSGQNPVPVLSLSQPQPAELIDRKMHMLPEKPVVPLSSVRINIDAPEISDNSLGSLLAHRDTILQRAEQQLTEGLISRQKYNDIIRDFNCAVDSAQLGAASGDAIGPGRGASRSQRAGPDPFPLTTASIRPSISAPSFSQMSNTGNQVGPGFDPIPANNRIYVDGRAYEVRYIDDVAVIERNGLPHRIYFVGTPRDVVVDGFAHTLAFGESKTISIDGQPHVIRFGAPSRELYMGPFPFRGSFGGPPIRATINGTQHKIQLCGPPPEVKIDPEPAYELLRYVKESHMPRGLHAMDQAHHRRTALVSTGPAPASSQPGQFSQPPVQPQFPFAGPRLFDQQRPVLPVQPQLPHLQPQQQQPMNVMDLYSQLVNSGIIVKHTMPTQEQQARSATPPIPSKIRFGDGEVVERKLKEPDLCDFATGKMKTRYVSVIEALYKQKTQCTICGMRFPDSERQKYSKHLDWHFQQTRRDKDRSNLRPWYLAADDWIRHEELVGTASIAKSAIFESSQKQQQPMDESGRVLIVSTDSVITASDDSQECAVCSEKFEQFWDEDEEVWKMRNAILIRGKAYHPLCYQDVQSVDSEPGESASFAVLPEDFMASNSSGEDSKNVD